MQHNPNDRSSVEEWLAGATVVGVMVLGLWQVAEAVRHPALVDVPHSWEAIHTGVGTDKFSKHLDNHLPVRDGLIAWANAGRYLLTRGAGDQVRLGRDEWLFSVEELAFHAQSDQHLAERVAKVENIARILKRQGVSLVVVPVPDKARVHAEQTSGGVYPAWYANRYTSLVQGLESRGLFAVNLLDTLTLAAQKEPVYYKTDTHWNQRGAGLAAESVANRVRSLGVNLPLTQFVSHTAETPVERAGDLLKMMGLVHVPDWARPDPDSEAPQTTTRQATASSAPLGLLGDAAAPPVVLVGTSYSLRANFQGQLQEQLKTEVLNVAKDGGGFMQAMSDYLNDDAFKTAPPKLVVWEVPERVFSPQLTELEKAPITAPQ